MYQEALKIIKKLNENGYNSYIIGGYPRDMYIGLFSDDVDICTSATPDDVIRLFEDVNDEFRRYGNVIINSSNYNFQVTTFRKDNYISSRRDVIIEYVDNLEEDLKRRDFIINTLCVDQNGNYYDLMGARDDIDNKIIRLIGDYTKLIEDPLRILRALRFSINLDFKMDSCLIENIIKYGSELKNLSEYRIKQELDKIKDKNKLKNLITELELNEYLDIYLSEVII